MSEIKKITEQELLEFNTLKEQIQANIFEFGQLYLEKMELDELYKKLTEKETGLRSNNDLLRKKESELMSLILSKYGEGGLNLKDGTFTKN